METLIQKIYKLFYNKPPTEEQVINDAIKHKEEYTKKLENIKKKTIKDIEILIKDIEINLKLGDDLRLDCIKRLEKLSTEIQILNLEVLHDTKILLEKINEFEKIQTEIVDKTHKKYSFINYTTILSTFVLFYIGLIYYYRSSTILQVPIDGIMYKLSFYDIFRFVSVFLAFILTILYKHIKTTRDLRNIFVYLNFFNFILFEIGNYCNIGGFGEKEDPYKILGINKDASLYEIQKAYRKRAVETHPDRGGNQEEFIKVRDAYEEILKSRRKDGISQIKTPRHNLSFFHHIKVHSSQLFPFLKNKKRSKGKRSSRKSKKKRSIKI